MSTLARCFTVLCLAVVCFLNATVAAVDCVAGYERETTMVSRGAGGCGGAPYLFDILLSFDTCVQQCYEHPDCIKVQHSTRCYGSSAASFVQGNEPNGNAGWSCRFKVSACVICDQGTYSNGADSACLPCSPGYSTSSSGSSVCDVCAAGYEGTSVSGTSGCCVSSGQVRIRHSWQRQLMHSMRHWIHRVDHWSSIGE